jgi:hypothetical protein
MSDKAPGSPNGEKPGKTLEEKRTAKQLKRNTRTGPDTDDRSPSPVTEPGACWYRDPGHQPRLGWCPRSCTGAVIYSELAGNGEQHLYCDTHGDWRRRTIRLPLVRRMRPGEQPSPSIPQPHPNATPALTSTSTCPMAAMSPVFS